MNLNLAGLVNTVSSQYQYHLAQNVMSSHEISGCHEMNELEAKIERIIKIVEYNRLVSKGTRRWILRWMRNIERDVQLLYKDIQTMKKVLVAISKKIKFELPENYEDDEEIEDTGEIEYRPKSEDDLQMLKPKLDPMEWSYFI